MTISTCTACQQQWSFLQMVATMLLCQETRTLVALAAQTDLAVVSQEDCRSANP